MLYRLPNGTWINPANVTKISPYPVGEYCGLQIECHVTVICDGDLISLPFEAFGDACAYANELADAINSALSRKASDDP